MTRSEQTFKRSGQFTHWFQTHPMGWKFIFVLFVVLILAQVPRAFGLATAGDQNEHNTVKVDDDDASYQILAINLLYGKGYVDNVVLPLELYHLDQTSRSGAQSKADYDKNGVQAPLTWFYRAPGFPVFLTVVYAVFGNDP